MAFVREIRRGPVNFPHKWLVTRKMFPFDDVITWDFVTMMFLYNLQMALIVPRNRGGTWNLSISWQICVLCLHKSSCSLPLCVNSIDWKCDAKISFPFYFFSFFFISFNISGQWLFIGGQLINGFIHWSLHWSINQCMDPWANKSTHLAIWLFSWHDGRGHSISALTVLAATCVFLPSRQKASACDTRWDKDRYYWFPSVSSPHKG